MSILKRYQLKKQQRTLMQKRDIYERLQTEHSDDEYFQKYAQSEMDAIDAKAEHIRGLIEGRWGE